MQYVLVCSFFSQDTLRIWRLMKCPSLILINPSLFSTHQCDLGQLLNRKGPCNEVLRTVCILHIFTQTSLLHTRDFGDPASPKHFGDFYNDKLTCLNSCSGFCGLCLCYKAQSLVPYCMGQFVMSDYRLLTRFVPSVCDGYPIVVMPRG